VILRRHLDRETVESYRLTLIARDGGDPPLSGSLALHITVTDVNDNNPEFDQISYSVNVREGVPVSTIIYTLTATDRDTGVNGLVRYGFTDETIREYGQMFGIRNDSGKIFTKVRRSICCYEAIAHLNYEPKSLLYICPRYVIGY